MLTVVYQGVVVGVFLFFLTRLYFEDNITSFPIMFLLPVASLPQLQVTALVEPPSQTVAAEQFL